ncbi:MAG: CHAT domain-containing protein, partial [Cytophagales bacterium]
MKVFIFIILSITAHIVFCQNTDADLSRKQGELYYNSKDYAKAIEKFSLALKTYTYGDTSKKAFTTYLSLVNKLGLSYYYIEDYNNSIKQFRSVENISCKTCKNTVEYSGILNNLANSYLETFKYSKAEEYFKKSLLIKQKVSGKQSLDYAIGLNNLADLYNTNGNFFNAEPLYKQALVILEKAQETNSLTYAIILNNLAEIFSSAGSYELAVENYKKSIAVKSALEIAEESSLANSYINLATTYLKKEQFQLAEEYFVKGLKLKAEIVGTDNREYGYALHNFSELYFKKGDYAKALKINLNAFEILKSKINANLKVEDLMLQASIATKYFRVGNLPKADSIFKANHELFKAKFADKTGEYALFLMQYSDFLQASGNFSLADALMNTAVKAKNEEIKKVFKYLSDKEKNQFIDKHESFFNTYFKYSLKRAGVYPKTANIAPNNEMLTQLFNFRLNNKAMILSSSARLRHIIFESSDTTLKNKYLQWEDMRNLIAQVNNQNAGLDTKLRVQQLVEKANALEIELYKLSDVYKKVYNETTESFETIKGQLGENEACVEILRIKHGRDTVYYFALIVDKKSIFPKAVFLEKSAFLEKRNLKYYRNSIKFKEEDLESNAAYWQPIAQKLASGTNKIYLSPDGIYNVVNISSFKNADNSKYVIEDFDIHLVSNLKEVLKLKAKAESNSNVINASLFGRPEYFVNQQTNSPETNKDLQRSVGASISDIPFADLPGTEAEVNQIGNILKKSNIATELFLKAEATEGKLKEENNTFIVHIATHGYFIPETGVNTKESMLRSGVVMAGVNPNAENDGLLTAYELSSLDFSKTSLLVFSACETGLGEVKNGEGVYGLQRAATMAGAKTVLMSLWTVDDLATKDLMIAFYTNLVQSKNKRQSLRDAQLQMLK